MDSPCAVVSPEKASKDDTRAHLPRIQFLGAPCYTQVHVTPFLLERPRGTAGPVLVEVPHSGTALPEVLTPVIRVPADSLLRDADIHVADLYRFAPEVGATFLSAHWSRYVVDLNRAPDDFDSSTVVGVPARVPYQPRGVVWRMTTDGDRCLARALTREEFEERLGTYYAPYHAALEGELKRLRSEHGFAVLLAAHSMPSVGRTAHRDRGARRADVVPGTRGRTTAHPAVIDLVDQHFRDAGLSVRHDEPYRGGFTTGHYGRPASGWHAIQIELNRALYVDETTFAIRESEAQKLITLLRDLVRKLGQLQLPRA